MTKKNVALLGGVLIIAGGLIIQNLYKKDKLKGLEDYLKPLLSKGKKAKKKLEDAATELNDGASAKINAAV